MLNKIFSWFKALVFSSLAATAVQASAPQEEHPVVILGGGVGALTSAVYLSQAGITPIVVTGPTIGGAITQSHSVQNWPGEMQISGVELSERLKQQAVQNGAVLLQETVVDVDFSKRPFVITTKQQIGSQEKIKTIKAQTCIIGLGATPRFLQVPGESRYWSKGVYSCAVCDGGLYKDRTVAIVGGGDSALTQADYLSNLASKVYLIVRGEQLRTVEAHRMQEILGRPNVEVLYSSEVKEIKGDEKQLTHVVIKDKLKSYELAVDGVFLAIGSKPNTEMFRGKLELDSQGYILLKKHQETSVPGVYAVGDVADPEFQQAVTAAADGSKAALQAQKQLTQYRTQTMLAARSEKREEPKKVQSRVEAPSPVVEIETADELRALLSKTEGGVIVDFYGNFCGPCRMIASQYEAWAKEFQGKITFAKVNVEKAPALCHAYQIRVIPTLVVIDKDGRVVRKSTGAMEIAEVGRLLDKAHSSADLKN